MKTYFTFDGVRVPVRIKKDWRSSIRYSITKTGVNIILPKHYVGSMLTSEIEKLQKWCIEQFSQQPELFERFKGVAYEDKAFINIYNKSFQLLISKEDRKTISARIIQDHKVHVRLPKKMDQQQEATLIGKVLSRVFSNYFLNDITQRVYHFNNLYFQEQIESVRLKNNISNWGSCSSNHNINLSSRLLFAPQDVIDYVIIHELSHLKQMNHSPAFWSIVSNIMPDYKEKEAWLEKNGAALRF